MNRRRLISLAATIAAAMLVLPGIARAQMREPGGSAAIAATATATVKAVDPDARTVTLETSDGQTRTIKCGKEVINFDQIKPGDQVKALAIARLAVSVGPPDSAGASEGAIIARAPKGDKPGVIISGTERITATVEAVDPAARTVTLVGVDGQTKPIQVAKDVDLSSVKKGDDVTVQLTKGVALWVQSPEDAARPAAGVMGPGGAGADVTGGLAGLEVATKTATVEAIDKETRTITLKTESGQTRQIPLGKEVINFDQIAVGDKVRATLAEEVAIAVSKGGALPDAEEGTLIARAPRGEKPGILIADSTQVTGKIQSVDADKRTITLTDADGKPRTVKAAPRVNLSELSAGDSITARVTQALAIVVEKP